MSKKVIWLLGTKLNVTPGSFRDYYAKIYSPYQFPVDRFNVLQGIDSDPIATVNIVPKAEYNLSNLSTDWRDRYFNLIDEVAGTVYEKAGNRTIVVFYSGGVDSTAVLIALKKHSRYQEFLSQKRLVVALTSYSIYEYPEFFYNHILPEIPIIPADYNSAMDNPDYLVVTGDGGDYVIGNTDTPIFLHDGTTENLHLDKNILYPLLNKEDPTGQFSYMLREIDKKAPFDIESVNQLYWWLGQCFTHQGEMCYPYAWSGTKDISELASFNKIFRFFLEPRFMTYAFEYMSTNPVMKTLRNHRDFPKAYIVNYTGDTYYLNKIKIMSQRMTTRKWHKTGVYEDLTFDTGDTPKITT